ncbi:hypothetical protein IEQ34_011603 [Dendrobium chrysotoxum]|uniref:26S proteasome regulatory subunit 7-like OB domain-containing protein n=1 Tax=Dendrobium chrysotoxum TaxID=161865 RepID=A0AAV7GAG4_DENCH|nr:hypothetical protein IEQ34_011603 [Dendrobium chrysotoxum]
MRSAQKALSLTVAKTIGYSPPPPPKLTITLWSSVVGVQEDVQSHLDPSDIKNCLKAPISEANGFSDIKNCRTAGAIVVMAIADEERSGRSRNWLSNSTAEAIAVMEIAGEGRSGRIKELDTGLAAPRQWDLVSDKQMMQEEQPLQLDNYIIFYWKFGRFTSYFRELLMPFLRLIINPNTEDAKYVINVKQIAKYSVSAIGGARFDDGVGGDNQVQRTMLEIVNQLDGFDA